MTGFTVQRQWARIDCNEDQFLGAGKLIDAYAYRHAWMLGKTAWTRSEWHSMHRDENLMNQRTDRS